MKAPNTSYVDKIYYQDDPYEFYIPINELAYSLNKDNKEKNLWNTIYWIEWLLQYSKVYNKKYEETLQITRRNVNVPESSKKDFIWLLWDIILDKDLVT